MPEPWRGGRRGEGRRSSWPPTPLQAPSKPPNHHTNLILEPEVVTNGVQPSNLILELTDPFSDKGLEEDDDVDSVILPTKVVIAPEGARYAALLLGFHNLWFCCLVKTFVWFATSRTSGVCKPFIGVRDYTGLCKLCLKFG